MLWAIVFYIAIVTRMAAHSWPIGGLPDTALAYDLANDYYDGPWNPDYYYRYRYPSMRPGLALDRYGFDLWSSMRPLGYEPYSSRFWDYGYYGGYPKTEVAKNHYIKDIPYGGTEVGIRDSVSTRSGPWRTPSYLPRSSGLDRFYNPYYYDSGYPYGRGFDSFMMAAGRPSSLRWGGDMTYLRR